MRKYMGLILVFMIVMTLSVGYSAFNTDLSISGEAVVRVDADIRVTSIEFLERTEDAYATYNPQYSKDSTSMFSTLPPNSSVTYEVEVTNKSNEDYALVDINNDNSNVVYELIDTELYDSYKASSSKKFKIKITNNTSVKQINTLILNYKFAKDVEPTLVVKDYEGTLDKDIPLSTLYEVDFGEVGGNVICKYNGNIVENVNYFTSSGTYEVTCTATSNTKKMTTKNLNVNLRKLTGNAVEVLLGLKNDKDANYDNLSDEERKQLFTFEQPATTQLAATTDYRYIGANPNNYVRFNNELWRIIGVFSVDDGTGKVEQRLKLIRKDYIGGYSWDNKSTSTGAEDLYGKNNWSDARLNYLLNEGHTGTGGSLYWNRTSGMCYAGQSNKTISCDFTSTGLTTDAKK